MAASPPLVQPRSASPSSSSKTTPALPFDILYHIFDLAAEDLSSSSTATSQQLISPSARVSRSWEEAVSAILWRSCSLSTGQQARAFVRTARQRPDLASRVTSLAIGLGDEEQEQQSSGEQASSSQALVEGLEQCDEVKQLEVKSLHGAVREQFIAALAGCRKLEVLVASPRVRQGGDWSNPEAILRRDDFPRLMQALPALQKLDLDAWLYSFDSESTEPGARAGFYLPTVAGPSPQAPLPHPHIRTHLNDLHLRFNIADVDLYALLASSGPTLTRLDLYTEHVLPPTLLCAALATSLDTLISFKWITNPPLDVRCKWDALPTFDRLLPRFTHLESLIISATDVSWNLLALLPSSLRHLEVQAFTYQTPFRFSDAMIETLADHSKPFHLHEFIVRDSDDVWSAEQVLLLGLACAARYITFTFIADEDVSEYGIEFDAEGALS